MRKAGGVTPRFVTHPPAGRFLSIDDRERIFSGVERGLSIRAIARSIGRQPSTVMRELARNMDSRYRRRLSDGTVKEPTPAHGWRAYRPTVAQQHADANSARPKVTLLATNKRLRLEVQARLKRKDSPEQISNRLRIDFPDDAEMRVSPETIYQALYIQGRGALKRELVACLRTGRTLRKPQRGPGKRRARVLGMVNISERPAEAEDRAIPGHWEGDLIIGQNSASAIGTIVERATGHLMLLHLPERHGALEVQEAIVPKLRQLPDSLRRTLTWDQGIEMANHVKIAKEADIKIYFCDPHSPWQRGSNENTNGLLRQYFPKGTDLSGYHPDYLDFVADQLNTRPRKRLGWATPAEALDKLLAEPFNPPGVALTA
jgi:transposase, IS30 family